MAANGWAGADAWAQRAAGRVPMIIGGLRSVELPRRCVLHRESANAFYRMSSGLTHASLHVIPGRIRFNPVTHLVALEPIDVGRAVADCVPPLVGTLVTLSTVLVRTGWAQETFDQRAHDAHVLWSVVAECDE